MISLYGRGIVMAELGFGSCSRVVLLQTRLAPNAAATDERHWHNEMISDDRAPLVAARQAGACLSLHPLVFHAIVCASFWAVLIQQGADISWQPLQI